MKILLINGWGGLIQSLQMLQQALQKQGFDCDVIDYIDVFNKQIVQEYVENIEPYDVIAGWSLGGQVATVLLDEYYQKYPKAPKKTLWTLFSNPCFIVNADWKLAQTAYEFLKFEQAFIKQPKRTLHLFFRNISENINHQQFINMQNQYFNQDGAYRHLLMGLNLLKNLNTLPCLERLNNHHIQHICFLAETDHLAPLNIHQALTQFTPNLFFTLEYINFNNHFSIHTQATEIAHIFKNCIDDKQ